MTKDGDRIAKRLFPVLLVGEDQWQIPVMIMAPDFPFCFLISQGNGVCESSLPAICLSMLVFSKKVLENKCIRHLTHCLPHRKQQTKNSMCLIIDLLLQAYSEMDTKSIRGLGIKHLLIHKMQDQGSNPQNPCKCWANMVATCKSRTKASWLARPTRISGFCIQQETLPQ